MKKRVSFWLMRSGTSKGPYIDRRELRLILPNVCMEKDRLSTEELELVVSLVGSGHPNQLNGVGGGSSVTTKACVVEGNDDGSCKYWFLQCGTSVKEIDHSHGDCGNMIAGVGCFALELGIVPLGSENKAKVNVHSMQTGSLFEIVVPLNNDKSVSYSGDVKIAGVPGSGSSIIVNSLNPMGSQFKKGLWPTGSYADTIENIPVTCVDSCRGLIILEARNLHLKGTESKAQLDNDASFMKRLESIRLGAALKMGLGDCSHKVSPKICLVSPPLRPDANIHAQYFVSPFDCDTHPTIAMTAAQALAVACKQPGTVPHGIASKGAHDRVLISHEKGIVPIYIDASLGLEQSIQVLRTGYERTVRPIVLNGAFPLIP